MLELISPVLYTKRQTGRTLRVRITLKQSVIIGVAVSTLLLLFSGAMAQAAPKKDETFNQHTFFCKTRYGLMIEGEAARKQACQKGYDTKECPDGTGEDKDGTIKACNAGRTAARDLLPEPDRTASGASPTIAAPEPPRLQAQSGTQSCAGVDTAFLSCRVPTAAGLAGTGFGALLSIIITVMAAAAGIVAVGAFVFAGIVYASAGGNPSQVKKARDILKNTVIGIVLFAALYGIIEFIVPGGLF